jgi:hypothetical protein
MNISGATEKADHSPSQGKKAATSTAGWSPNRSRMPKRKIKYQFKQRMDSNPAAKLQQLSKLINSFNLSKQRSDNEDQANIIKMTEQ